MSQDDKMEICVIAAYGQWGQVGLNGKLPWDIPGELKHFKDTTLTHPVIMGRKTHESIGRPLPGRANVVISTTVTHLPGVDTYMSLGAALEALSGYSRVFVIGGPALWDEALKKSTHVFLSVIDYEGHADTYISDAFVDGLRENFTRTMSEDCGNFIRHEYTRRTM